MTKAPTKSTVAGRAYLAIQKKARADGRPTDELLHLLALDLAGRNLANSVDATVALIRGVLASERDDGWVFGAPSGATIRDEDQYSGVRVTIPCALASARFSFHVDVNFGGRSRSW